MSNQPSPRQLLAAIYRDATTEELQLLLDAIVDELCLRGEYTIPSHRKPELHQGSTNYEGG